MLMRTGARLVACSWALRVITDLAGLHGAWLGWAVWVPFLAGLADIAIAALFSAPAWSRERFGAVVEFDEAGIRVWTGRDALERRRERRDLLAMADLRAREKRLLPLSPGWRDAGVEFPERPAYSRYDRHGRPQPPFPVHFRNPAAPADGWTPSLVLETHSDPDHEGCPVCKTWKEARKTWKEARRTWEMSW